VNDDVVADGDVRADFVPLADGGVLYVADREVDETFDRFHAPVSPAHLPARAPTGTVGRPAVGRRVVRPGRHVAMPARRAILMAVFSLIVSEVSDDYVALAALPVGRGTARRIARFRRG